MDIKLASYLFGEETLYAIQAENKESEKERARVKEPEIKQFETVKKEIEKPQIDIEEKELVEDLEAERVFKMKTQYLFVFNSLSTDNKDFLLKIIQALGLSFTKVDLLDIQQNPLVDFKETIHENTIKTIVFFGEKSGKDFLPKLGLPLYQLKTLKNIQFIYSENLNTVSKNKDNQKRRLWEVLKEAFQN